MTKRLLNIGLLVLIILFTFQGMTFAEDMDNPFSKMDRQYEERLDSLKGSSNEQASMGKRSLSNAADNGYIVKFNDNLSMKEIHHLISQYNYKIIGRSNNRTFLMELGDIEAFKEEAEKQIDYIDKDIKRKSSTIPSDEYYRLQWGLPAIKLPEAWTIEKGNEDVFVSVIDSGIQRRHPDLTNTDIRNGWDYLIGDYCNWDSTGHGTSITGIIAAETNNKIGIAGTNWNGAIIPFRVANFQGEASVSDSIQAIYDAADLDSHVINLSFGSGYYIRAEEDAINYAINKGSIVVAAAGNRGMRVYDYPASYEGVVSVGSVGEDLKISNFSQYNDRVTLVAPGENIYTTMDMTKHSLLYDYVEGTSFSTAYVSGIAALMKSAKPSLSQDEFIDKIRLTSTDLGSPGYDIYYGHGLINGERMLESVTSIRVKSVLLDKSSSRLEIGDTLKLRARVFPENAADKHISWTSSNPKVASVDNGLVTALGRGKAKISARSRDGGIVATFRLKVENGPVWDGFTGVGPDKLWNIDFNKRLDDTSWENNIQMQDSNGVEIPIEVERSLDRKGLIISPLEDYKENITYTITIDKLRSDRGHEMTEKAYISFLTQGDGGTVSSASGKLNMASAPEFTDIGGHWGKDAIIYLAHEGIVKGDPESTFRPNDNISRAEFTAMINRAMELSEKETLTFTDVANDSWYYDEIAKAVEDGYANGYPDNLFKPGNNISRQEASVMIGRALYLEELDRVTNKFKDDRAIASWARGYVNVVKEAKYIEGADNIFRPIDRITRAEAATILYRVLSGEDLRIVDVY